MLIKDETKVSELLELTQKLTKLINSKEYVEFKKTHPKFSGFVVALEPTLNAGIDFTPGDKVPAELIELAEYVYAHPDDLLKISDLVVYLRKTPYGVSEQLINNLESLKISVTRVKEYTSQIISILKNN